MPVGIADGASPVPSDLTLLELEATYATLDEASVLEEFGGVLLTEALTAEPPLVLLDMSKTTYIGTSFVELLQEVAATPLSVLR